MRGTPISRHDNHEPFDFSKVTVTSYQRRADGESGRGDPEVVLIKRQAAALPSHLHACIVIASTWRNWLACQRREQFPAFTSSPEWRFPAASFSRPNRISPRATGHTTTWSPVPTDDSHDAILPSSRMMALIAFVSRRYVTMPISAKTDRAFGRATVRPQSPHRVRQRPKHSGEAAPHRPQDRGSGARGIHGAVSTSRVKRSIANCWTLLCWAPRCRQGRARVRRAFRSSDSPFRSAPVLLCLI